jgi:osmotically-inducible protein OsmY
MRSLNVLLLAAMLVAAQGCSMASKMTASSSEDLRSKGTQVDDDTIETKAMTRVQEKYKDSTQITVTSYNRFVLITGDAPTEEVKTAILHIVQSVPNVKDVSNEISVGRLSSSSIHHSDAATTREIKSELGKDKSLRAKAIKVTTDKGVVYLLGLVTHAEAKTASEIASVANGVQKVVRVFEYID